MTDRPAIPTMVSFLALSRANSGDEKTMTPPSTPSASPSRTTRGASGSPSSNVLTPNAPRPRSYVDVPVCDLPSKERPTPLTHEEAPPIPNPSFGSQFGQSSSTPTPVFDSFADMGGSSFSLGARRSVPRPQRSPSVVISSDVPPPYAAIAAAMRRPSQAPVAPLNATPLWGASVPSPMIRRSSATPLGHDHDHDEEVRLVTALPQLTESMRSTAIRRRQSSTPMQWSSCVPGSRESMRSPTQIVLNSPATMRPPRPSRSGAATRVEDEGRASPRSPSTAAAGSPAGHSSTTQPHRAGLARLRTCSPIAAVVDRVAEGKLKIENSLLRQQLRGTLALVGHLRGIGPAGAGDGGTDRGLTLCWSRNRPRVSDLWRLLVLLVRAALKGCQQWIAREIRTYRATVGLASPTS